MHTYLHTTSTTVSKGRGASIRQRLAAAPGLTAALTATAAMLLAPASAQAAATAPAANALLYQVGPYCPDYAWGATVLAGSAWAPGVSNANIYSNNSDGNCANGDWGGTDAYGLEYQCTELGVRWADDYWGVAPAQWGGASNVDDIAAKQMWSLAQSINGLQTIANGTAAPQFGDLLILSDNGTGHVAVIVGVHDGYLYFVGENQDYAEDRIPITNGDDLTASAVSNWLGQTGTALGWISGTAPAPQLGYIKNADTGSGTVEVHVDTYSSGSYNRVLDTTSDFSPADAADGTFELFGSVNGEPELGYIKNADTGSGTVEVHVDTYSSGSYHQVLDTTSDFSPADAADGTFELAAS